MDLTMKRTEQRVRAAAILKLYHLNPQATYQEIASKFEKVMAPPMRRQRVAQIVSEAMRSKDPDWEKPRPLYTCSVCKVQFPGEDGYTGTHARRCPEHRRQKSK